MTTTLAPASAPPVVAAFLEEIRAVIDRELDRRLAPPRDDPGRLAEAMHYAATGPGKRLRPAIVLAAAEACGATREVALPAAAAIEMLHAYTLVHDDLPAMDNDELRRGRPTVHVAFGEAIAILAGDGLLTEAFGALAELGPQAAAATRVLARRAGSRELLAGQAIDLARQSESAALHPGLARQRESAALHPGLARQRESAALHPGLARQRESAALHPGLARQRESAALHPGLARQRESAAGSSAELASIERMHAAKTGALFAAAAELGAIAAGAPPATCEALGRYGMAIGIAFQHADDRDDAEMVEHAAAAAERMRVLCGQALAELAGLGRPAGLLDGVARWIMSRA